ncbi:hypothetical protein JKP88DRAFT_241069 [Tribonema minus]|uniref:Uncharacterized protein n=1 Tax=Tribonema minus TaxID=303371 RepID=A0A836CK66_9STRA|nr:hypothetical protein JKP88DRAFT_241069 [Tribonema minus]
MSFESNAWGCKTGGKFSTIAAISIIGFLVVNAVQHHAQLPVPARHALNVASIIMPQLMLSIGEAFCKDKKAKTGADTTRLLVVWSVPLIIYGMGSSDMSIKAVCKFLNVIGISDETVKKMAAKVNEAKAKFPKKNAQPYWARFEPPVDGGEAMPSPAPETNSNAKSFTHFRTTVLVPPNLRKAGQRMRQIVRNPF